MDPNKTNKFNLDDLKKENPFQVPEHYFDSLGARIADRIEVPVNNREVAPSFLKLRPVLAFSGGFLGLALIVYFSFSVFFTGEVKENTLANTEIANLDEYAIVSQLDEAVLIEAFSKPAPSDLLEQDNNEHIIDYLVKEDIDISTIIEEL